MDRALAYNKRAGKAAEQRAEDVHARYLAESRRGSAYGEKFLKELREEYEFFSPKLGYPVHFRRGHAAQGDLSRLSACFAYAAGYGPQDHIFDREPQGLAEALAEDSHVLLSHNEDFYHNGFMFNDLQGEGVSTLDRWIGANYRAGRRHISLPVHSAKDALSKIHRLSKHLEPDQFRRRVNASFRGGVMQYGVYNRTSLRKDYREKFLTGIFDALSRGEQGVPVGATRVVGFPRLIRWMPTAKSLEEDAVALKGNFIESRSDNKHSFIMDLAFADKDARYSKEYKDMRQRLVDWAADMELRRRGIFVLGCPFIALDPEADPKRRRRSSNLTWDWMGIAINDIERQIYIPETPEFTLK